MAPYIYVDGNRVVEAATDSIPRSEHQISIISGGPKAPSFDFEAVVDTLPTRPLTISIESLKKTTFSSFPLTAPHLLHHSL